MNTERIALRLSSRDAERRIACSRLCAFGLALFLTQAARAQQALTWDQVEAKFEANNPAMKADADNVDEMKAEEITAFLRPNPQFTLAADGNQAAPHNRVWTPFKGTTEQPNFSYLQARPQTRAAPGERAGGHAHHAIAT